MNIITAAYKTFCREYLHVNQTWRYKYKTMMIMSIVALLLTLSALESYATTFSVKSTVLILNKAIITVSGKVIDENGQPLIGVSVKIKGTTTGALTSAEGRYTIKVTKDDVLQFTFIGYKTVEKIITDQTVINIAMEPSQNDLDAVVVVGFGVKTKATNVGAMSSISTKDLKQNPVTNLSNALAGRLPGLITQQRGGEPGRDDANLLIRGITTLSAGAASPLVLVDGVERPFSQIDFNEVESVSILKDASSTAVYGVRGANGVILVTTRRGASGKAKIALSANYGLQSPARLPEFVGSYDYATLRNEAVLNDNPNAVVQYSPQQIDGYKNHSDPFLYPDVDYYSEFLKKFTPQSTVNLNVSGGGAIARYFVSGSYADQQGIYKNTKGDFFDANSSYKRFNFRSNIDINASKTTLLSVNMATIGGVKNSPFAASGGGVGGYGGTGDIFSGLSRTAPNEMNLLNPDGTYGASSRPAKVQRNILADLRERGVTKEYNSTVEIGVVADQKLDFILKGLSAKANLAFNSYYTQFYNTFRGNSGDIASAYRRYSVDAIDANGQYKYTQRTGTFNPLVSTSSAYADGSNRNFYLEGSLFWKGKTGKSDITALLLYNQQRKTNNTATSSQLTDWPFSRMGAVGRVTYAYDNKYLAEINAGYNGSENFQQGQQFGFFPSFSAGWLISQEDFIKNNAPAVTYLKLRGSIGQVGNDALSGRRFLYYNNAYASGTGYSYGLSQGTAVGGLVEGAIPTNGVTWEKETSSNLGLELNLWGKKFGLVVDAFYKKRVNILTTPASTPVVAGITLPVQNLGEVENKGFEIEANTEHMIGNVSVWIRGNFAFARNKILAQDEPAPKYEWMNRTGRSVGQGWGYVTDGFYNSQSEVDNRTVQAYFSGRLQPGDFKYKDIDGDGYITSYDQVPIGQPTFPEITYGFSTGFSWKGLDGSILFAGADRTSMFVTMEAAWEFFNGGKVMNYHMDRWTPATAATATYPRLSSDPQGTDNNYVNSDFWNRDASFIRLKNAEIGYTFSKSLVKKLSVGNIRCYINGQNLFTYSKGIKYLDPENRNSRAWYYPQSVVYNLGLSVTF
ncbi:MAG TPA: TonB-dependent receptor [Pedobacter sp.]|nr:TonB-dependent receptor [Pedobacter sp.]